MNLAEETHQLIARHNLRPRRENGQNFLIDEDVLGEIIATARLTGTETVLEIGAGLGTLTRELALHAGRVIAVELDRRLTAILRPLAKQLGNVTLVTEDIKRLRVTEATRGEPYVLVANLPYNLTSWILHYFLEYPPQPMRMVVMVQKEVAERIVAQPGNMSILAIAVQYFATPRIAMIVPASAFEPAPAVESALLEINDIQPPADAAATKTFFRVVKAGFSGKRKKLINSLSAGLTLPKDETEKLLNQANIDSGNRAEDLSLDDWKRLVAIVTR